jgi:hypothetical protein
MPIDTHPRRGRSPEEIIAEQKTQAAREKESRLEKERAARAKKTATATAVVRKPKPAGEPRADAGERKAPIDIDARLAAMRWRGPGDSAINVTQRDVTAAMLAHGIGAEETVRTVLDATRVCVAGDPETAAWIWTPA